METMKGLHRTHGCGTISEAEVGKEVVLCGWVERRRDHGGLIFLDLRDRSGIVQVVASPDHNVESFHKAEDVRNEYVLCVRGKITKRDEAAINPNLPTGAYEMFCEELRILNSAKTPPFYIQDDIDVDDFSNAVPDDVFEKNSQVHKRIEVLIKDARETLNI